MFDTSISATLKPYYKLTTVNMAIRGPDRLVYQNNWMVKISCYYPFKSYSSKHCGFMSSKHHILNILNTVCMKNGSEICTFILNWQDKEGNPRYSLLSSSYLLLLLITLFTRYKGVAPETPRYKRVPLGTPRY